MPFTKEVMQVLFDIKDGLDRLTKLEEEADEADEDLLIDLELREFIPTEDRNGEDDNPFWQFFQQLVAVDFHCRSNSFVLTERPIEIAPSEYEALLKGCLAHLYHTRTRVELKELITEFLDEIDAEHYLSGEEEEKNDDNN